MTFRTNDILDQRPFGPTTLWTNDLSHQRPDIAEHNAKCKRHNIFCGHDISRSVFGGMKFFGAVCVAMKLFSHLQCVIGKFLVHCAYEILGPRNVTMNFLWLTLGEAKCLFGFKKPTLTQVWPVPSSTNINYYIFIKTT